MLSALLMSNTKDATVKTSSRQETSAGSVELCGVYSKSRCAWYHIKYVAQCPRSKRTR